MITELDNLFDKHRSQWKIRNILVLVLCVPLLLLSFGSEIGILPSASVMRGENILDYDIKFLQRKGVLKPEDKISYFYSDAMFFLQDDGNGFTDRHVFSYWKENGKFQSQSALMEDIQNIEITWSKDLLSNTIVNIIRKDESSFLLFVSTTDKKDKLFVEQLKKLGMLEKMNHSNHLDGLPSANSIAPKSLQNLRLSK